MKLSIIIPVYFNEQNLPGLYENLKENVLAKVEEYELIFVDDGSGDNSYLEMQKLKEKDNNIKLVKLSKNFGSHMAILAGYSVCTGDCATIISADLQDPPEIIIQMFEKWKEGSKVVLAIRQDRDESLFQKLFSNTYYNLVRKFALKNMPKGGFDCSLIDRQVIDILVELKEKNTSIMCQILWCGFTTDTIYYTRRKREIGKSRWTLSKKVKLLIDTMCGFSYFPIRMIETLGVVFTLVSFIWAIFLIWYKTFNNVAVEGWTTLMIVILLSFGLLMMILGVIGEYLWRTFDETRKRPPFIIEKKED